MEGFFRFSKFYEEEFIRLNKVYKLISSGKDFRVSEFIKKTKLLEKERGGYFGENIFHE